MSSIHRALGVIIIGSVLSIYLFLGGGVQASLAEGAADSHQDTEIALLKKEIEDLRHDNGAGQSEAQRISLARASGVSALAFLAACVFFFLLRGGILKFEGFVSEKGVIRESAQTLRLKTLSKLLLWVGSMAITLIFVYVVLDAFGVNVAPLLAGAGIVGVALGFGGQYLIRDIINGVFILVEGQFGVNDIVKIGEFGGVVEEVNLRTTMLRDVEGQLIIIPNGEIKVVINMTKGFAQAVLNFGVAYKENVDHVMETITEVGRSLRADAKFGQFILDDLEMLGVEALSTSDVTIRCRIKTIPSKQWDVSREMRRRVKNRFDELGIEIPFPHRTLYWGREQKPS